MPKRSAAKGGRPPVNRPTGRKVTVYMLPDVEARARDIGGGNLSGGVLRAVLNYTGFPAPRKAKRAQKERT